MMILLLWYSKAMGRGRHSESTAERVAHLRGGRCVLESEPSIRRRGGWSDLFGSTCIRYFGPCRLSQAGRKIKSTTKADAAKVAPTAQSP